MTYAKAINELSQMHCINYLTLMIALLEKGCVDEEELAKARIKATHIIDQEWTKKQKEAQEKTDELYPCFGKFFGKIFGPEGENKHDL